LRSLIHRKRGKPMPRRSARANNRKSKVRAAIEHVFARQKGPMGLFIRTHRHRSRQNQNRLGQYPLQHEASALAHRPDRGT
jgi:hypothetical protein